MPRRQFLPVSVQGKPYKLFVEDIKKVNQAIKKRTPHLPKYQIDQNEQRQTDNESTPVLQKLVTICEVNGNRCPFN